jgi:ferredoxin
MEGCTACGLCGDLCPDVLKVNGKATVIKGVNYSEFENLIKCVAECCPVQVIKYSEKRDFIRNLFPVYGFR